MSESWRKRICYFIAAAIVRSPRLRHGYVASGSHPPCCPHELRTKARSAPSKSRSPFMSLRHARPLPPGGGGTSIQSLGGPAHGLQTTPQALLTNTMVTPCNSLPTDSLALHGETRLAGRCSCRDQTLCPGVSTEFGEAYKSEAPKDYVRPTSGSEFFLNQTRLFFATSLSK